MTVHYGLRLVEEIGDMDSRRHPVQVTCATGTIGNDVSLSRLALADGCPVFGKFRFDSTHPSAFPAANRSPPMVFHLDNSVSHCGQYSPNGPLGVQIVS